MRIYDKIIGRMFVHEEEFMENEAVSKNFIEQEIDKDLAEGVTIMCAPVSRQSRTGICTSDMPSPFF
jgi:hypothetical protein